MTGVLFIINIPLREHEEIIKAKLNGTFVLEKEKLKKTAKIIERVKESEKSLPGDNLNNTVSSTAQLDDKDKRIKLSKTQSENVLTADNFHIEDDSNMQGKSPWDAMKRMKKIKRNKLKISRPVRGADILEFFHWDTPLEIILTEIMERLGIQNAAWNTTKDSKFWQVTFSLESGNLCEELVQILKTFGIGSRHRSAVSVVPCTLYYTCNIPENNAPNSEQTNYACEGSAWSRFSSSVRARTHLPQVLEDVRADAALTFDWIFLLIVAAFVAAIGLIENSTVILVASMLISPLMGPITAATLGAAVHDRSLQRMGVIHELLGLFLSLIIGFLFGLAICAVDERFSVINDWPTYEMISRCEMRSLWVGILIAIPSGAGVALAVLGENTASLVGVAISASLLPPAVNAGLLWAMAFVRLISQNDGSFWAVAQPTELALLGTASLCLTLINIVCIFIAGVVVYKIKKVCPLDRKNIASWQKQRNNLSSPKNRYDNSAAWKVYSTLCDDALETDKATTAENSPSGLIQNQNVTSSHMN